MDALDISILKALQKDARTAFSDIAKDLGCSPGVIQARYNKMKKTGVIKGSTLILNMNTTGTFVASIGVRAIESELEGVNDYIKGLRIKGAQIFSWTTLGRYNIATAIFSRNLIEVHKIRHLIKQHPSVYEVSISVASFAREYSSEDLLKRHEALNLDRIFKV